MKRPIIVASRQSTLAVIQSRILTDYLEASHPELSVTLLAMKTTGDMILDRTLDKIGGKGLFVRELDLALRDRRADLAVHSLKDMPMELDGDLPVLCCSGREDPRDVLILPEGRTSLEPGAPIGSSSLRRAFQLGPLFPGHEILPVRGNIQTRLRKLDEGNYGALVLAAAGLKRLGLESRIHRYFSVEEIIPAAGQGILAVQGRKGEDYSFLDGFADRNAWLAARCERAFVRELNGGCTSPVCAHAVIENETIFLRGLYYHEVQGICLVGTVRGHTAEAESLGIRLARTLVKEAET